MTTQPILEQVPIRVDEAGVMRIDGTRIPIDTVIHAYYGGATPEQIVESFPTLRLSAVYLVIAYYLQHRDEIDVYMREQEAIAAQIRAENEVRFDQAALKARLLSRLEDKNDIS